MCTRNKATTTTNVADAGDDGDADNGIHARWHTQWHSVECSTENGIILSSKQIYVRSHQIKSKFFHLHAHIILYDKIGYFIKLNAMLSAHNTTKLSLILWFTFFLSFFLSFAFIIYFPSDAVRQSNFSRHSELRRGEFDDSGWRKHTDLTSYNATAK